MSKAAAKTAPVTPKNRHVSQAKNGSSPYRASTRSYKFSSNGSQCWHTTSAGEPQNSASLNSPTKPAKDLTLTGLYNVLQALCEGRPLTAKEKQIHSAGLVGVLKTLHDELDAAVLQAYGWADLQAGLAASPNCPEFATARDELLLRLVALNAQRTAEEACGKVRWLCPAFQNLLLKKELLAQVKQGLEVDLTYK